MKKEYEKMSMQVIALAKDVVVTSGTTEDYDNTFKDEWTLDLRGGN